MLQKRPRPGRDDIILSLFISTKMPNCAPRPKTVEKSGTFLLISAGTNVIFYLHSAFSQLLPDFAALGFLPLNRFLFWCYL
jgi:hypothetical protein